MVYAVCMTRPKGTDEVRSALLDSAAAIYTEGAAFSVREVARRAGVNHGQVHHIFGGKAGLKRAMLSHLGGLQATAIGQGVEPETVLAAAAASSLADKRFVRALARRLLEDPEAPEIQDEFPVVERLRALADEAGVEGGDVLLGEGLARALGWAFFGPWIAQAAKLDPAACEAIERRLARPMLPGGGS
jgi:TetR/AcrR family transcriptional regulator, repressor for neighboring sulfatase